MLTRAERAAEVMLALVRDDSHGYSQPARKGTGGTVRYRLSDGTRATVHSGDYDCSEAVRTCYAAVGVLPRGSYMWTGNECDLLTEYGFQYVGKADLRPGDVLWRRGHTEMVVEAGGRLMQAGFRLSETGGISGRTGDQTGREGAMSPLSVGRWERVLRLEEKREAKKEEDGMRPSDVWDYEIGKDGTTGKDNAPAWVRLSWAHHDTAALYKALLGGYNGSSQTVQSGAGLAERICWIDTYCGRLVTEVAALTEAVKTLAEARGADPDAVAKAVSDAVAAKLASIELRVDAS